MGVSTGLRLVRLAGAERRLSRAHGSCAVRADGYEQIVLVSVPLAAGRRTSIQLNSR